MATPASAMPPLSRVTKIREPRTRTVRAFHGRLPMERATVTNAMRPPRIGAVDTLSGRVEPARAVSSWSVPQVPTATLMPVSVTMARNSATRASNSWRMRRRTTMAMEMAMGRPSVPIPPMMFRASRTKEGRREAPCVRSESIPAAVLLANQASRTVAAVIISASMNRARSSGRRTRRGPLLSSITSGPGSVAPAPARVVCPAATDASFQTWPLTCQTRVIVIAHDVAAGPRIRAAEHPPGSR
jgi:hypothetical protein